MPSSMINWRDCTVPERAPPGCELPYKAWTLCELCDNAYGFCRWSAKGIQKPVEGWTAIRRDIENISLTGYTESYVVLECPEFVLQECYRNYWEEWDPKKATVEVRRRDAHSAMLRKRKRK